MAKHSLLFGAVDTARSLFQDQHSTALPLFISLSLYIYVYICLPPYIYLSLSLSRPPHSLPLCWFINLAINFVNSEKEVALSRCLSMSKATKLQQPQPQRLRSSATQFEGNQTKATVSTVRYPSLSVYSLNGCCIAKLVCIAFIKAEINVFIQTQTRVHIR